MEALSLLLYLGRKGALSRPITIKTVSVGNEMRISQQSVSRWLMKLVSEGIITRKKGIKGYIVKVTAKGETILRDTKKELNSILVEARKITITGRVVSGMMEGRYYLSQKGYTDKIKSRLGFRPFPGTLNLRLISIEEMECKEKLCSMKGVEIAGFSSGDRAFGSLRCFPCWISGVECAVVIPDRSHYGFDILEIISPKNLRKALSLKDGDEVKVEALVD